MLGDKRNVNIYHEITDKQGIKFTYALLSRFNRFKEKNLKLLKYNLRILCAEGEEKFGGRIPTIEKLGMTPTQYGAMINPAHPSTITFEVFIRVVTLLNLDIMEVFAENKLIIRSRNGGNKFWDNATKWSFINCYDEKGIEEAMEQYAITEKTAMAYYEQFHKDLKIAKKGEEDDSNV